MTERSYNKNNHCEICGKRTVNGCFRCKSHRVITEEMRKNLKIAHLKKMEKGTWANQFGGYKGGYENKLYLNRQRRIMKSGIIGSHTLEQWEALKKKYNYICLCCKKTEPEITLSEDHIFPISKGGTDNISNIQPLCRSCNSRKQVNVINYLPEVVKTTMEIINL